MKSLFSLIFYTFGLGIFSVCASQATENPATASENEKFDPKEIIKHHVKDAHSWHLFDKTDHVTGQVLPISIPLPVIVYFQGHLDVFMSSAFHHGESQVIKGDRKYILYHEKIYMSENGKIDLDEKGHAANIMPLDFSITKNVTSMLFSAALLLLVFVSMGNSYKKGRMVPKGFHAFMEPVVVFIKEDIAIPNIGEHKYEKYLPYLLTAFFFIWFNNMLGLLPMGANVTGNIAVTLTLAFCTLLITNFSGSKTYWKHIFLPPGVPWWLWPIMVLVELIGILSKPFALMIRLFANISAGHIIVLSLISLIFIFKSWWSPIVSVPFTLFIDLIELLVAILQAYIFTLLSALFIGLAVQESHH